MKSEDGVDLFQIAKECALKAGIYDRMFLGFGTCLGAVRPTLYNGTYKRGFMHHDKDCDLCFLPTTSEERNNYYQNCKAAGLFEMWDHPSQRLQKREDDGSFVWFSIKNRKMSRSCNWFMFEYKGYMWHSKGRRWTALDKFKEIPDKLKLKAQGVALGTPINLFEELVEIDFECMKMNIPAKYGTLMDYYYPQWHVPKKGGSSKKNKVLLIPSWGKSEKWRIL